MNSCSQCGAVAAPTDKFCNTCGFRLSPPAHVAPVSQANAPAPPAQPVAASVPTQPSVVPEAVPETKRPALAGFFVSFEADPAGEYWALRDGILSVGRAEEGGDGGQSEIAVRHGTVSSAHAQFCVTAEGAVSIEDAGSSNGTYVNDEKLPPRAPRPLRDGDRVRFGRFLGVVKLVRFA